MKTKPFEIKFMIRDIACLHSQVGGIQYWFNYKQQKCKHLGISFAPDKLGDLMQSNYSRLLRN